MFVGALAKLRRATISFVSVCLCIRQSASKKVALTGRSYMKIWYYVSKKTVRKIQI